jgi:hypothetical protein
MQSSVPAFKDALLTRLKADMGLTGVGVSWGNPHPKRMGNEVVIIGNATGTGRQFVAGLTGAIEKYNLEILISVVGPVQSSQQTLLTRAYALFDTVENSVLAWKDTGYDAKAIVVLTDPPHDSEAVTADIREASVIFNLIVTAGIQ